MMRRRVAVVGLLALASGCVPVTEPLIDPEQATPDKALLGEWTGEAKDELLRIDAPAVKGNPKGLMRFGPADSPKEPGIWFVTCRIGDHAYATALLEPGKDLKPAAFEKEGAYAEWKKQPGRKYGVAHYTVTGNEVRFHLTDRPVAQRVMAAEKIPEVKDTEFFQTQPGWLAGYLEKKGPGSLFPTRKGSPVVLQRAKK